MPWSPYRKDLLLRWFPAVGNVWPQLLSLSKYLLRKKTRQPELPFVEWETNRHQALRQILPGDASRHMSCLKFHSNFALEQLRSFSRRSSACASPAFCYCHRLQAGNSYGSRSPGRQGYLRNRFGWRFTNW